MLTSFILADVPPPVSHTQDFSYCIKIANLNKYPDRLFFVRIFDAERFNVDPGPYRAIGSNRCIALEHRETLEIFALPKSKVNKQDLKAIVASGKLNKIGLQKLLIKNTDSIYRPDSIPKSNSGKKIEVTYAIKSIDKTGINLTQTDNPISNLIILPFLGLLLLLAGIAWRSQCDRVEP